MFEILVNGVSRTWRDLEGNAIAGGRALLDREKGAIVIVNRRTAVRCQIWDGFADRVWKPLWSG